MWTESQRLTLRTAIRNFGLLPGLKVDQTDYDFRQLDHNWNLVCNGGLVMGALAIEEDEPEICREIVALAAESVPKAIALYAPGGAYPEGVGYWAYATKYLVAYLATLNSALSDEKGFTQSEGLAVTAYFPLYMTGPTGRTFNYYDATEEIHQTSEMFWLASTFDSPVFGWWGMQGAANEPVSWQQSPAGLLWYRPELSQGPADAGLPLDRTFSGSEVVSHLSEWQNSQANYVAAKAGDNSTNHGDLDLGTFVLDALGVRWAVDLGPDDYNLPGYWFREPGGARWELYRKRAEGHNTLVVNPGAHADQLETAVGHIERFECGADAGFSVLELDKAHPDIEYWRRGVGLFDARSQFVIQDEVTLTAPGVIWWFLHTRADIELGADLRTATLSSEGESVVVRLAEPVDATFQVLDARPLSSSPDPHGQDRNEGVRKLALALHDITEARISVQLTPIDSSTDTGTAPLRPVTSLEQWRF
ncbi:heparinase II/III domain-containing protein [Subtercola boreus]|uniref:heparinase II/III domain-containing protein n=1 Tax=Subtercola boreus TaxID=120213 RepID=UPI001558E25C|nr:heparinase II/III family protein [Subtercola boreus]